MNCSLCLLDSIELIDTAVSAIGETFLDTMECTPCQLGIYCYEHDGELLRPTLRSG
jgi:hypothetical protein